MNEEEILHALEAEDRKQHHAIREMILRESGPERLAEFDAIMRKIGLGITSAENCWHSLSNAQRRALEGTSKSGGRLIRIGRQYRPGRQHQSYRPAYISTVRSLCAHGLMAWDGGIPDPEKAAVVTERGRFVLAYGSQHSCRTCRK